MDRELVDLYNRELSLLYEHAQEFAQEYPGIADRLGGLARERADPMIAGLLEGTALLAARVQLKLKHEFPEFTNNLIEQLYPSYLAPVPSVMLARLVLPFGDPALKSGRRIPRGATLDAVYREKEHKVACTFTLCHDVTIWPFDMPRAEYLPSLAPIQSLGLNADRDICAGLRLNLRLRCAADPADEPDDAAAKSDPAAQIAGCTLSSLPIHLLGHEADAILLYEQIFAHLGGVHVRYLDGFGDPHFIDLGRGAIAPIGFDDAEALLPKDNRLFQGFDYISEYMVFPRKFLGFRVNGLEKVLKQLQAKSFDIILTFTQSAPKLAAAVQPSFFGLSCGTAINLFEKTSDRILINSNQHEYQVVPDRSQYMNFEAHRILDVFLHDPAQPEKVRIDPLYRASMDGDAARGKVYYALRRVTRKRAAQKAKLALAGDYVGTDIYLSVTPATGADEMASAPEISVRALCSNRHLTEHLPTGSGGADFLLRDNKEVEVFAAVAPTRPRESPLAQKHDVPEALGVGRAGWRLINLLSLNHLGLDQADARALREILSLFADMGDVAVERRIRGVRSISTRPVVRRLQQRTGVGVARGLEITVTLEDKAFEGSGAYLLGTVLDRFFVEYAALNHFTQTVIRTVERGVIMTGPARIGRRGVL